MTTLFAIVALFFLAIIIKAIVSSFWDGLFEEFFDENGHFRIKTKTDAVQK